MEQFLVCIENKNMNPENCEYHMCWAKNQVKIFLEHLVQLSGPTAFLYSQYLDFKNLELF